MANAPLTLSQALNLAISAYNAGKFVEAEQICQHIIIVKSDDFDALHLLAVVQSSLGKTDTALANYDRALELLPDNAEALYNRGNTLHVLKRFAEALASYDRAITVRPGWVEALSNRGNTLHELMRFAEALASYLKLQLPAWAPPPPDEKKRDQWSTVAELRSPSAIGDRLTAHVSAQSTAGHLEDRR